MQEDADVAGIQVECFCGFPIGEAVDADKRKDFGFPFGKLGECKSQFIGCVDMVQCVVLLNRIGA